MEQILSVILPLLSLLNVLPSLILERASERLARLDALSGTGVLG